MSAQKTNVTDNLCSMDLSDNQLAGKPKRIGTLRGAAVYHLKTRGGYHLVKVEGRKAPIGVGPHKRVAYHIAQRMEPDLQLTELSKADYVDPVSFEHLLPKYEIVTLVMQRVL